MENNHTARGYKIALVICNIVFVLIAVVASVLYARNIRSSQIEAKKESFAATVESMKSVSQNYLDSEQGYVNNWASYINENQMTRDEALEFCRKINTDSSRYAHIVDMDTLDAWSAYYPPGEKAIDTYHKYKDNLIDAEKTLADAMREIFDQEDSGFRVLGRYKLEENLSTGVSVGKRITLKEGQGTKDYLLLRIIPAEVLKKTWVFPAEYSAAEVGIITRRGEYVIQSVSMKSISFPEYIRGYNFEDDYNRVDTFIRELEASDNGMLYYKDFRGEDCLWYYSSFGTDSDLDILGMIPLKELQPDRSVWLIVLLICGTLAVLIVVDGMYLRKVNVRLRRTAELAKQASEAKTQFLSAMSHDIRTPMNGVLGMLEIAGHHVEDTAYVTQCLEKARSAGKRLLTLINDILDISKIESGQFVLNPTEVSLKELFTELIDMLTPQMQEKHLSFCCEMEELPHPVVIADQIRLNQIYMNLFSNAVKYTEPGGEIKLQLYENAVPEDTAKTELIFCLKDTGIGMTPEFQQLMYQSFSREINTQVNATQGSGLGLAIVHQMISLMGGTITCDSTVGKGTTFTVRLTLPVVSRTQADAVAEDETVTDIRGMHLLIAEDNDLNWEVIKEVLGELGITCERAENGRICVELYTEKPAGTFDAILMDVQMPEMNGREACRRIRAMEDQNKCDIPVLAMTADAFAEDVKACRESGMNGHIAKPIDTGMLTGCLKKIKQKTI